MKLRNLLITLINLLLVVGGIGLVGYGVWQIYPPAAYITVGAALVAAGLPSRNSSKHNIEGQQ